MVNAIYDAIEKQREVDGDLIVDRNESIIKQERTFEELLAEAREIWVGALAIDATNGEKMTYIVEKTFGQGAKLSQATERQKDLLEIVLDELRIFQGTLPRE